MVQIFHVSTSQQLADMFTKALGLTQFHYVLFESGVINIHSNLWGSVTEDEQ
jgi:hypothetical protein